MNLSIFLTVVLFGLLHGLEPGHGWPLAFLYSIKKKNKLFNALISSGILSVCHLISSFTVVIAYLLLSAFISIPLEYLRYIAALLLFIMGVLLWKGKVGDSLDNQHEHLHSNSKGIEHEHQHEHINGTQHLHIHKHEKTAKATLLGLGVYGLMLGFAHEEEFALLSFVIAGINPWLLMIVYSLAVTAALITITIAFTVAYEYFLPKIQKYQKYIPKISAVIMFVMSIGFLFNLL